MRAASRKAGELSKKIEKASGGDRKSKNQTPRTPGFDPKGKVLEKAGISTQQASDWERLAAVPRIRPREAELRARFARFLSIPASSRVIGLSATGVWETPIAALYWFEPSPPPFAINPAAFCAAIRIPSSRRADGRIGLVSRMGLVGPLRAHYHTGRLLQGQRALEADRKGFFMIVFEELGHGDCRWPVADCGLPGEKGAFLFCGLTHARHGCPYCADHMVAAYKQPALARNARPPAINRLVAIETRKAGRRKLIELLASCSSTGREANAPPAGRLESWSHQDRLTLVSRATRVSTFPSLSLRSTLFTISMRSSPARISARFHISVASLIKPRSLRCMA